MTSLNALKEKRILKVLQRIDGWCESIELGNANHSGADSMN